MIDNPFINKEPIKVGRALISVFDKNGIVELAQELIKLNIEIISTGGTAETLRKAKVSVIDVGDYTNFPEIMDGRVKTINPLVEGGILGLRDQHEKDANSNNIKWIDLVVCNLYPFSETISKEECDLAMALENVDIGGPTMIRSAAKNLGWVTVLIDPKDYETTLKELRETKKYPLRQEKIYQQKHLGILHNMMR